MKKGAIIIMISSLLIISLIGGIFLFIQINDNSLFFDEQNDYIGGQTTIIHKDFKALIKSDWQEFEIPPSTYIYLLKGVKTSNKNAEAISINIVNLGSDNQLTLEGLLDQGIENSKKTMSDLEITEDIDWSNEHLVGKKIKFTGTQEGVKRSNIQVFGIKYNNLYSITYSCPIDECNSYAIYNVLIESFEPIEAEKKN